MGLKAANAFWNPFYYHPSRWTLTKKLIFFNEKQFKNEIRSLIWIAIESNRSLILPNALAAEDVKTVDLHRSAALWPGFRLAYAKPEIQVDIIEPAFYWRIRRDYLKPLHDTSASSLSTVQIPHPSVISMVETETVESVFRAVASSNEPRIILNMMKPSRRDTSSGPAVDHLLEWADDSVGAWRPLPIEKREYGKLAAYSELKWPDYNKLRGRYSGEFFMNNVRICKKIFAPMRGNRRYVNCNHIFYFDILKIDV